MSSGGHKNDIRKQLEAGGWTIAKDTAVSPDGTLRVLRIDSDHYGFSSGSEPIRNRFVSFNAAIYHAIGWSCGARVGGCP